ncbi:MAG: hypothetical protein ACLQBX_11270 [Candidatus Limnocylindrales bacterium]
MSVTSLPVGYTNAFSFNITQQSTTGNGMVTINNIHNSVTADAPLGPVQVEVFGLGAGTTQQEFATTLSNATVGTQTATSLTAVTAAGVTTVGPFTTKTTVVKVGKYITVHFAMSPAYANQTINVWVASKTNGTWSKFAILTTRLTNAEGDAYFYWKSGSAAWLSIQGQLPGSSTLAPSLAAARQLEWK